MARVLHIALAKPAHRYAQEEVGRFIAGVYPPAFRASFDIEEVFKNSQVRERRFVLPLEDLPKLGSAAERNRLFLSKGLELCQDAVRQCLSILKLSPAEIDALFFISSTGFAVPSPETYLIQSLDLSPAVHRIPIVGWGCTGGVAGLQAALRFARGNPRAKILLLNLETCSLAFQPDDVSAKSVVANAIFNDGATAALIAGREADIKPESHLELIEAHSHLFPNSSHLMGWDQLPSGLQVVLSPEIPTLAKRESKAFVNALLEKAKLPLSELRFWLLHPGGAKVLQSMQESLELGPQAMEASWENLRRNGNMSSCSVLAGLKALLETPAAQGPGLACAFGPGFACEGILFSK